MPTTNKAPKTPFIFKKTIFTTSSTTKPLPVMLESKRYKRMSKDEVQSCLQNALAYNIAVSPSGRTLKTILSLDSRDLSSYKIGEVTLPQGPWDIPIHVEISSYEKSAKELSKDVQVLQKQIKELQIQIGEQQIQINEMNARSTSQKVTMIEWQAANFIADFAWEELSDAIKAELKTHAILDFHHLSFHNSRPRHFNSEATRAARSAYLTIHRDIRRAVASVLKIKEKSRDERAKVPDPDIPAEHIEALVRRLRAESPGSQHPIFAHLRVALLHH